MKFHADAIIAHPREIAYPILRDELADVAQFMPNISRIDVGEATQEADGVTTFVNVWHADAKIPSIARPLIKPHLMQWTDHARWVSAEFLTEWRGIPAFMADRIHVSGTNTYEDLGDGTCLFAIDGDIEVDPPRIARGIKSILEHFVVDLLRPNLRSTAQALEDYLDR